MKAAAWGLVVCVALLATTRVPAHELRPAYLELREVAPGTFDVLFKTPMRGDLRLGLRPVFSGNNEATPVVSRRTGEAMVETWRMRALDPLRGQEVTVEGLETTMTDTLVRVEYADGASWIHRLTPAAPNASIPAVPGGSAVVETYLVLGFEHILLGLDHLLFVLALVLIAPDARELIKAVTAFTVAHSITLAAATLGLVTVPPAPVEALIALSIVFVALEIVRARNGQAGLAARAPWLVAFAFGLLHGFGFAGALSQIGLPPGRIPLALLFFNLGVEVGQLLIVGAAVLVSAALLAGIGRHRLPPWAHLVPPYVIGSVATFWVISRVAAF